MLAPLFLLLGYLPGPARAEPPPQSLGSAATTGQEALNGLEDRRFKVLRALACGDEIAFLSRWRFDVFATGSWPTSHLISKASHVERQGFSLRAFDGCVSEIQAPAADWNAYLSRVGSPPGRDADNARVAIWINRYYARTFGDDCGEVASAGNPGQVRMALSSACMIAQIAAIGLDPRLGRWKYDQGKQIIVNPGTDGLPCVTEFPWGSVEATAGDWDMTVYAFTRLAYLLDRALDKRPDLLTVDIIRASTRIDRFILTLRGGPAEETYNLIVSCGNPDNSQGTADDFLNDNDAYDDVANRTAGGRDDGERSFWEDLWKWLRFLAPILALAALALAIGAALGGIAALIGGTIAAALVGGVILANFAMVWMSGIEETENHLLMQNTSKYLKNKRMLGELRAAGNRPGFVEMTGYTEDVRRWLLDRAQRIVEEDFLEYNSKPYNQFSIQAFVNLADFACDRDWAWWPDEDQPPCDIRDERLRTASQAVLDMSAAKVALGSSQGRRLIPFRRQAKEVLRYAAPFGNPPQPQRRFLDLGPGADHLLGALQFWTGVTKHGPDGLASGASFGAMYWHATSEYVPPALILDLAVDKSTPYMQTITHDGYERYSSGPGWLITAGGDRVTKPQGIRFRFGLTWHGIAPSDDFGVGVPTSLMTNGIAARRDRYDDLLRFEGQFEILGDDEGATLASYSANRCVTVGFACGAGPQVPPPVFSCFRQSPKPGVPAGLRFINSAECPEYADSDGLASTDFFLVIYRDQCRTLPRGWSDDPPRCPGGQWGFFEVVSRGNTSLSFSEFADRVVDANRGNFEGWKNSGGTERITYRSVTRNVDRKVVPVYEDFGADCRACGDIIVEEDDAKFRIKNPRFSKSVLIDLTDDRKPVRDVP